MQSNFYAFCQNVPVLSPTLALSHSLNLAAEFSVVSSSSNLLPSTWQGFLLFWGRSASRVPFRVHGKSARSREAAVSALLSSPFNAALQNVVLCFWGSSCYSFLPETFSFFKKYSAISFSITAVWFWFRLLPEYSEGWDHHTVVCAVVEGAACSV